MFTGMGGEGFLERGSAEERKVRFLHRRRRKNGARLSDANREGSIHELNVL